MDDSEMREHHETVELCDRCAARFVASEVGRVLTRKHSGEHETFFCAVCRHGAHLWTVEQVDG